MNIKVVLIIIGICPLFNESFSQGFKKNRIGYIAQFNSSSYVGDVTKGLESLTYKPGMGIGICYGLNSLFSVRAEIDLFRLSGGEYSKNYSISFVSNNAELSSAVLYNFLPHTKSYKHRSAFSPYLFAGIGLTAYKANVLQDGNNLNFRKINDATTINITPVIPFGAGLKIKAGAFTDIIVEAGFRKTFTDKLDNITTQLQTTPSSVASDLGSGTAENSGNTSHADGYVITSIKLVYSPNQLFKKKIRSATPQSKWISKKNKATSRQISKNKKLASDKLIRLASNQ